MDPLKELGTDNSIIVAAVAGAALALGWIAKLKGWIKFNEPPAADSAAGQREVYNKLDKHEAQIKEIGREVSDLRSTMRGLADKEAMHKIELGVMELEGDIRAIREMIKPIARTTERIDNWLMKNAG